MSIKLSNGGAYLVNGTELIYDGPDASERLKASKAAENVSSDFGVNKDDARRSTIAYGILEAHNTSGNMDKLKIKFDKLTSHDITFVGIIQTARASGLTKFPIPYVLTNCHNSLCAVGGTINEDDHMFGLSCAKKYGGIYVPPHQAVIHQFAREMLATGGGMILGSDSHTRYGALGTMAVGEGGPELVKQLLSQTYDIRRPDVIAVYMTGEPARGVGPQDVALAIIGAVFDKGYVKNKVMEFVGPGVSSLSADFRIGVDVMTTETTCLSSIWRTDDKIKEFYDIHGRTEDYKELNPGSVAYYDGVIEVDLSKIKPMIAMPFHPSNTYTIEDVQNNLKDILHDVEERAKVSLDNAVPYSLQDKIVDGRLHVDQGIIAGCAGGGFENICAAGDILRGASIGSDGFTLSVYPASMPIYMEIIRNGVAAEILETGAVLKTAFCGPCFGAGDTPANNAFSIRHSTRNFPNREGSKLQNGQIASVALMDARSIASTAANKGVLTAATEFTGEFKDYPYHFDKTIYENRVFDSKGKADPDTEIVLGPNIKDWPAMPALTDNLLLKVVSEIHDPVTTTDELIPSGETSSYRSNPLGLAEFALSRKDPAYVGRAKEVQKAEKAREAFVGDSAGEVGTASAGAVTSSSSRDASGASGDPFISDPEIKSVAEVISKAISGVQLTASDTGIGSTIYAVKPGDGSAREQAASCQKVLGGWANIASEYATKRYRSNLINWGMLPFIYDGGASAQSTGSGSTASNAGSGLPFKNLDYIYIPGIREAVLNKSDAIKAYAVDMQYTNDVTDVQGEGASDAHAAAGEVREFTLKLGDLTDEEREIILKGCLINFNRV